MLSHCSDSLNVQRLPENYHFANFKIYLLNFLSDQSETFDKYSRHENEAFRDADKVQGDLYDNYYNPIQVTDPLKVKYCCPLWNPSSRIKLIQTLESV